jgi:hypothetical protein
MALLDVRARQHEPCVLVVGLVLENAFQARRGLAVTSREVEERGGVSLDHGGKRIQIQHVGHPANRFVDASPSQAYVDDDMPEARFEQARGELHRPLPGSARRLEVPVVHRLDPSQRRVSLGEVRSQLERTARSGAGPAAGRVSPRRPLAMRKICMPTRTSGRARLS